MAPDASTSTPEKPPPGWVIGPDGKPCKICTAFRHMKVPAKPKKPSSSSSSSDNKSTAPMLAAFGASAGLASSSSPNTITTQDPPARPDEPPPGCPPDVEQLGRATWSFLHTTAAYYPDSPSPSQRSHMLSLLRALPALYPCTHCASHLGERMGAAPPDVSGRRALSLWLCERHNEVNERLGKESFDCAKTDERWKDGPPDGSCD
ncbi:FAD-dependent thiol oxidase, partial [Coniophora puteana RWD-64-598 SS2]